MPLELTRRSFLAAAGLGLGGLALAPAAPLAPVRAAPSPGARGGGRRVVVLGAGLAGLAIADALLSDGFEVTVLEARLRAGGRIRTLREPFAGGLHAEAGAARIQGSHARVHALAERLGLELDPFLPPSGDFVSVMRGRRVRQPIGAAPDLSLYPLELPEADRALGLGGMLRRYLGPAVGEVGDPTSPGWPGPQLAGYDRRTFYELMVEAGAPPDLVALLMLGTFEPRQDLSALYMLRFIALGVGGGPLFKVRGGNDRLPFALAERLSPHVRYGRPVVRIEHSAVGARVLCRTPGGGSEAVAGGRLVVTLPLGALADVEVVPPLSAGKRRAIAEVRYEALVRVLMQTGERPWEADGLCGFGRTDTPAELWHSTFDQPGRRGIVTTYFKASAGEALTALGDEERLARGAAEAERVLPGVGRRLEGGVAKCWAEDPWAQGAFALFGEGQMTALWPHVGAAEGCLHFAGDHTSAMPGWMEGALESAERVVAEVRAQAALAAAI